MQLVSSRISTLVAVSISYDDNHYTTGTSKWLWNTYFAIAGFLDNKYELNLYKHFSTLLGPYTGGIHWKNILCCMYKGQFKTHYT